MAAAVEEMEQSNIVPELTEDEKKELQSEQTKKNEENPPEGFPNAPDYPLADRVEELGLMKPMESDPEFYEDLKTKSSTFYFNMKDIPDAVGRKYYPDLCRRFIACERRIKVIEKTLWNLPREERSQEEDRFEILTEVLDKACQGFEIWDEHIERNIPIGHRLVLEARLVHLIDCKFDIIMKICGEFDKLKGDRHGADNEREWLRYEIRHCDHSFVEIHESLLKSYLGMEWAI